MPREAATRLRQLIDELETRWVDHTEKNVETMSASRRRSIDNHDRSFCGPRVFQHPSTFRTDGIRVADRVHSASVVRSCAEMCIDTINYEMRNRTIVSTSDYIRCANVSVVRSARDTYGTVSIHGPSPHTTPEDVQYAFITDRTPALGLDLPLAELRNNTRSHIPVYLTVEVMRLDRWGVWGEVPEFVPATRLTKREHPRLAAALERAAGVDGEVHLPPDAGVEVPLFGGRSWMDVRGGKYAMALDYSYVHAMGLVFTPHGYALLVDTNEARPGYVDEMLQTWVESLGFEYKVAQLPALNQHDSRHVKEVLTHLAIDTPVTIKGYCASLTLCYLIDTLCTQAYDETHLQSFVNDIVPPGAQGLVMQACIVLYARAIANDCLKLCLLRFRQGVAVPRKWPSTISVRSEHTTRVVSWKDVFAAVRAIRR